MCYWHHFSPRVNKLWSTVGSDTFQSEQVLTCPGFCATAVESDMSTAGCSNRKARYQGEQRWWPVWWWQDRSPAVACHEMSGSEMLGLQTNKQMVIQHNNWLHHWSLTIIKRKMMQCCADFLPGFYMFNKWKRLNRLNYHFNASCLRACVLFYLFDREESSCSAEGSQVRRWGEVWPACNTLLKNKFDWI